MDRPSYWLSRFVFLRLLGLVYAIAFLVAWHQAVPLIGSSGLTPVTEYLVRVRARASGPIDAWLAAPSLLWLDASDLALKILAGLGVVLSLLVLAGFANAIVMAALWILYQSIRNVGQVWYGYGWEILLLETGSLAIVACPLFDARPFPRRAPPLPVVLLLRWLTFRVMFGAGLIKLRGSPCWRDLSCLTYHYETQPLPNPISRWLHFLPAWWHRCGVGYNHLVELIAPFFLFWPRWGRHLAGAATVLFQLVLIVSGNLSFLNWLTIAITVACFDDRLLARMLPQRLVQRAELAAATAVRSRAHERVAWTWCAVVIVLSIAPVANLLSNRQAMNTSFDPLHLVNSYGAFGSVKRERFEIVLEGTSDAAVTLDTRWREYQFRGKPGDPARAPCVVSPYHYRLDWQMWFAADHAVRGTLGELPWFVALMRKLLEGDQGVLGLLAQNPFPDAPPRLVRALCYQYRFAPPGTDEWWQRWLVGECVAPVSLEDLRR